MWRLTAVGVAAGLIVAADPAAAGFWLPPDFGANNPNLAVAVGDSITLGDAGVRRHRPPSRTRLCSSPFSPLPIPALSS